MRRGRPKKEPPTKAIHLRIELTDLSHLEEIATREGNRTIASVVRQAVKEFLRTHPRERDDFDDPPPSARPRDSKRQSRSSKDKQ
jgi:hypothetical protein